MKMANIGIGVGAFSQGLMNGLSMGREMKKIRNENEIEAIRREGLGQARQLRDAQVESSVKRVQGPDGMTTGFEVGGQTFANRDEAIAAASKGGESVMDIFMKTVSPRIQEAYLAQGDIEKAEIWNNWAKSRTGKSAINEWAKGYFAAQRGDWDNAAKAFGTYYSNYIDNDQKYVGHETLKDDDGNVTGFTVKLKDSKTGKETSMPIGTEEMLQMGMANNPQTLFESLQSQQAAADKARLEDAKAERKYTREQAGRIELEAVKAQLRRTSEGKTPADVQTAEWLVNNGVAKNASDAWRLVKSAQSKSPADFAMDYAKMVTNSQKDDLSLSESKVTPEEAFQEGLKLHEKYRQLFEQGREVDPRTPAGAAAVNGVIFDSKTNQFVPIR